ncbi:hypothetical protein [Cuniculiplasma divulgatum]|jgi:hypothetical protein|uniref:Uncharacterized protein n=1 Tax=Cuniculiplasma divulgatum TaxID=1673428 RepID=A0A1R4A5T9_9ARCH|nr:hypothetical protein [Cuniculiplasma divulgatum]MCI2412870.1 hypothetical protein [Cuniculiplasma sp.]SJK84331.1 hypothetical protein CPM_0448 [Cuniculiplasma divulgatum]
MKPVIKEDKAVSEIIGAILLFAIASVLLTSFILWYVPSTGTNNDISYQSSTQNAFSSLDSKMINPSVTPGSGISQSFSLGISGTPPFTPSQSTNLYYSDNFNANLSYGMNVNYTNIVTKKTVSIAACANASSSNILNNVEVNNQFTYSINFIESGLSSGFFWTVVISGESLSSSGTLISATFPDGTYGYKISTDSSQQISNTEGSVVVNGSNVNIAVSFYSKSLNGILAENNGTTGAINPINSQNQIPDSTSSSNNFGAGTLSNWLTKDENASLKANYLGAQQFNIYSKEVTATYYTYYLLPSYDYMINYYEGSSTVFTYISEVPFGKNITKVESFKTTEGKLYSGFVTEKLNKPVILYKGSYYINFLERVNNPIQRNYESGNYVEIGATYGSNESLMSSSTCQWQYGPTEFIGTMSNPEYSVSVGESISYSAKYWENTGYLSSLCCKRADNFTIISTNQVIGTQEPYVFTVGYSLNNSTVYKVNFSQLGLTSTSTWNVTINGEKSNSSSDGSTITFKLPVGVYQYSANSSSLMLGNPSTGTVNVTSTGNREVNITFSRPRNSAPLYYGNTKEAKQDFHISSGGARINFISLYLYNFTSPPSSYSTGNLNYSISIQILNDSSGVSVNTDIPPITCKVNNSGWNMFFLKKNGGYYSLGSGRYVLEVKANDGSKNTIGWGFTTTGGYDNYLQKDASNSLTGLRNTPRTSNITGFNNGALTPVSNQVFVYSIGYYNLTVSREIVTYKVKGDFHIVGSLNSKGVTQFTISETQVLQDGIILTAGKGVTYVTVNPLPIRIVDSSKGISLSSIAYNMSMSKGVSTSVSGVGSTIVSMIMTKSTLVNYTLGNSYTFNNKLGKVNSICLNNYSYIIHSKYANYWAHTLFTELLGQGAYSSFSLFHRFDFQLSGNTEKVSIAKGATIALYSANIKSVDFNVDSI